MQAGIKLEQLRSNLDKIGQLGKFRTTEWGITSRGIRSRMSQSSIEEWSLLLQCRVKNPITTVYGCLLFPISFVIYNVLQVFLRCRC